MVKCIDCGYLCYRDKDTRELEEVERGEDGTIIQPNISRDTPHKMSSGSKYDPPICFARAVNLQAEYKIKSVNETGSEWVIRANQRLKEVLNQTRECESFVEWQQGFTPKEHREMLSEEWKLEQEAKRRKSDRTWHIIEVVITLTVGAIIALLAVYLN